MNRSSPESPASLPGWAVRLLVVLAPAGSRDVVLGDFVEIFAHIATTEGRRAALRWYVGQLVRSIPAFLNERLYLGAVMIGNYVKIGFRNLTKRTFFSLLNVGGLAIGMAACLLIFQYVAFEESFDTFHEHAASLYRVTMSEYQSGAQPVFGSLTYQKFGPALADKVPEVAAYARIHPNYGTATLAVTGAEGRRKALREDRLYYADPSFLKLFTFPLVEGDAATALEDPWSILLSETAARRFFGDADPVGKTMELRAWIDGTFTVRGVFSDVPAHSHVQFDFLVPMETLLQQSRQYRRSDGWDWSNFVTYIQLRPGADPSAVGPKLSEVIYEHAKERLDAAGMQVAVGMQPLRDIHLHSGLSEDDAVTSSYETVYFFTLVALFVLVIAWVNYVNLSTARALERAREVCVRKVVGARKRQVFAQFLTEAGLTNVLSLGLAVGLAGLGRPHLNRLAGIEVAVSIWWNPWFWGSVVAIFGAGAVLASLYPAFVLSAFQPATVLKGTMGRVVSRDALRKVLVLLQFAASMALLTGTYVVYEQVSYMRRQKPGVDLDQVLVVRRPSFLDEGIDYAEAQSIFREQLEQYPAVARVATSGSVPGIGFNFTGEFRRQSDPATVNHDVQLTPVSEAFVDVYDLEIVAGRNLSEASESDLRNGVLINESAARTLGFNMPAGAVGEKVTFGEEDTFEVVGVVKDFPWLSVKQAPGSVVLSLTRGGNLFSIEVTTGELSATLATVRQVYDKVFPGNPFDYYFADAQFDEQYRADRRFGTLFGFFAAFALLVACLGLVGLAAFTAAQRTREIGVRKVMGATSTGLALRLSADFASLVGLALVVAAPLLYFGADRWLDGFATRITLDVWVFVVPALLVLAAALLTVSYHTLRIARTNPVQALRYD